MKKMSAEQAAEEGAPVGEPYTPPGPGRGTFDVPSYDDIADLQILFKRFGNTAIANGGDTMSGDYNVLGKFFINGRQIDPSDAYNILDKSAGFNVQVGEVLNQTRFMCNFATDNIIGMPTDTTGIPEGARITIVQVGKGKISIDGVNVVGTNKTKTQYQLVEVMFHANLWWCLVGGGGGGGTEGAPSKPTAKWNADFTQITWEPVAGSASETYGYGALVTPAGDISYRIQGTTILIDRATSGIDYAFQVWGVNAAGQGEFSDPIGHTYAGVDAPTLTAVPGPAQIQAQWTQVAGVTGYRLSYKKTTDQQWTFVDEAVSAFGEIISGLAQVEYEVRVQAVDNPVGSVWSNTVKVVPGPGETSVPTVAHSAKSTFTITNYNAAYLYTVDCTAGSGTVTGDKLTLSAGNTQFLLKSQYAQGAPVKSVSGELRQYTTHKENFPYKCGSGPCNCREEWANCGCGSCDSYPDPKAGSWGQCGCETEMCWYGRKQVCDTCDQYCDDYRDVKDGTPSGFVDQFGEWSKVG